MASYRVHGKWILAGEHTVLRGGEALVFPVNSRHLDFTFEPSNSPLTLDIDHATEGLEKAFWQVYKKACKLCSLSESHFRGHLKLKSQIPVGAGMGASATLCAAFALWFADHGHIAIEERHAFAKNLEDLFHGESSGVDVAVALANRPLSFRRPASMEVFTPAWQPHFYLSYCGEPGNTAQSIEQVGVFLDMSPEKAAAVDTKMSEAVALAKQSLLQSPSQLNSLCEAIHIAGQCFESWGLVSSKLESHMQSLLQAGALAVKPTGSGLGGFVLSLWDGPQNQPTLIKA